MNNNNMDNQLEKKKRCFSKLEYDVSSIKNETLGLEKEIEHKKHEIHQAEQAVSDVQKKNDKLFLEHKFMLRDYLRIKIKLIKIYGFLKVSDLDSIIARFKDERIQYQGYCSLVNKKFYF